MALVLKDRVLETTSTTGTGTLTLSGAVTGYQSFSVIGNGNTTYYAIVSGNDWEVGVGTYTSSGTTLSRDTVLESSAGGTTKINVASGAQVFCTYPAEEAVDLDSAQTLSNKTFDGGTVFTASSTANAVRITQTGTGNALLVEDSANPDSTPVVINADGRLVVGNTASIPDFTGSLGTGRIQALGTSSTQIYSGRYSNDVFGPAINLIKSRDTTIDGKTSVASGDTLGSLIFTGADGTSYVSAAQILGICDGTPGTSDMPGRLSFQTTADGASTPVERMRINNAGQVSIGGAPPSASALLAITGTSPGTGTTVTGMYSDFVAPATATTSSVNFWATPSTAAASFTLSQLIGYYYVPNTFGAGSTVTNQYAFWAGALTGATNNYGFLSSTAAGTGRWNFYASGTAQNYFAGNVGIGSGKTVPATALDVNGTITATALDLTTPLAIADGGTGASTAPAANANLTGFTSTATAAGTTTLTNTSTYYQLFTGTSTQTITLPVTSTLATGWSFHIVNNSTGNLTVNSSGGNLVITVLPGTTVMVTCIGTTLTTAADWEAGYTDFSTARGTGAVVLANPLVSSTTSITSPLAWNSDNFDLYAATAQAGALTINADSGTPTDGRKINFRLTCDGTARTITFTGGSSKSFKPVGPSLTVSGSNFTYTLTINKTTYFGAIYNAASDRWEIVALSQEA